MSKKILIACVVFVLVSLSFSYFIRPKLIYTPLEAPEPSAVIDSACSAQFIWDDATVLGYFRTGPGDKVANMFVAQHPCSLFRVQFYAGGSGQIELHIWPDLSNIPDITRELILPQTIRLPGGTPRWITIELTDTGTGIPVIEPLRQFHVGFVILSGTPQIYASRNNTKPVGHLYSASDHTWYYISDGSRAVPFKIRAFGKYYNIRTTFWFTDVTDSSGISRGSRISVGDFDNDGWEDFLIDGRVNRNNHDGTFTVLVDSIHHIGLTPGGKTTFWDYDNDGDLDIIQLMGRGTPDRLWRNDYDSLGRFTNVTSGIGAAISDTFPSGCPGIGDFDHDGDLDLYIANSEIWTGSPPDYYITFPHFYYINEGSLFVEAADSVGMGRINDRPYIYGRICVTCDFDEDGDLDLYVGNYRLAPNWLFVNNGDGTFREEGVSRGVAGHPDVTGGETYYGHTIGAQWVDVDNDGDWDLFIANLAHPRFISFSDKSMLFINSGPPSYTFHDERERWGIEYYETHSSCVFGDFDNDGWQDLFISCVYNGYHSFLYKNCHDHFELVSYEAGIFLNNSWGAAWTDYDCDGDLDLVARDVPPSGTVMRLFRNEIGNRKQWVQFVLKGTRSDKFAVGSVVKLYCHELGFWQMRQVDAVAGTEGTSQGYVLHFGLNNATIVDTIIVRWMGSGEVDTFTNIRPNRRYTVIEGVGIESISESGAKPDKLLIYAYPNPFNLRCRINVFNPFGDGELAVFSVDGRKVFSKRIGLGSSEILFDASNLPSGAYVAVVSAAGVRKTKSLLIVK